MGLLAASVPREVVDAAVAASGRGAQRSGGKLPAHVTAYLTMALCLFADEDYEAVMARLTETLASWGCWDQEWTVPTSGGITQARTRLGSAPLARVFDEVAVHVAGEGDRAAEPDRAQGEEVADQRPQPDLLGGRRRTRGPCRSCGRRLRG